MSELHYRIAISLFTFFVLGFLLGLMARPVRAQEVIDLHDHRVAQGRPGAPLYKTPKSSQKVDPYTGIFNFDGVNCCTGQDCRQALDPKDFKPMANGYLVVPTGEFVPQPTTGFSPDQHWHICRKNDAHKTIRCLLVPQGGA